MLKLWVSVVGWLNWFSRRFVMHSASPFVLTRTVDKKRVGRVNVVSNQLLWLVLLLIYQCTSVALYWLHLVWVTTHIRRKFAISWFHLVSYLLASITLVCDVSSLGMRPLTLSPSSTLTIYCKHLPHNQVNRICRSPLTKTFARKLARHWHVRFHSDCVVWTCVSVSIWYGGHSST